MRAAPPIDNQPIIDQLSIDVDGHLGAQGIGGVHDHADEDRVPISARVPPDISRFGSTSRCAMSGERPAQSGFEADFAGSEARLAGVVRPGEPSSVIFRMTRRAEAYLVMEEAMTRRPPKLAALLTSLVLAAATAVVGSGPAAAGEGGSLRAESGQHVEGAEESVGGDLAVVEDDDSITVDDLRSLVAQFEATGEVTYAGARRDGVSTPLR